MPFKNKIAAALFGLVALPIAAASAAVIGGTYYAPQYDFGEFFAATDHRNFQVILAGNPFPGVDPNTVANALLPAMQAAKPRPALTFTYDAPVERPRPDYRLVLVFDSALDLGSDSVCRGVTRFRQGQPGLFYLYVSNGAELPVTALVDQFYARIQSQGGARWDTSSLIRLLR